VIGLFRLRLEGISVSAMLKVPFVLLKPATSVVQKDIEASLHQIIEADHYILGQFCKKFEQEYAAFNSVSECIGVGNGLDALVMSLKALGIGLNDEVIIPSNTFIATAFAVSMVGAKVVFVEPSIKTYNIQAEKIAAAVTSRTKVIMPVHLYGQACEMDDMMSLAKSKSLYVIEDNAQSQGAAFRGRKTGSFGILNATSFYPGKNLGAMGDAGAITSNDANASRKVRMIGNYGSVQKYKHEIQGQNSRLDEFQAAVLSAKLKYLSSWNIERRKIAANYSEALSGAGDLILPEVAQGADHVYHLYVVRTRRRDELQTYLTENGVETLIHYPLPIHLQGAYQQMGYVKGDFPIAEEIAETCLSLPLFPGLSEEMQSYVTDLIKKFYA
jgi:dTDP-4-amino-4,6-dideoxygalactose transaminase